MKETWLPFRCCGREWNTWAGYANHRRQHTPMWGKQR